VHGLGGDPVSTWCYEGGLADGYFWPRWLAEDIKGLAVYSVGYPAEKASWNRGWAIAEAAVAVLGRLLRDRPLPTFRPPAWRRARPARAHSVAQGVKASPPPPEASLGRSQCRDIDIEPLRDPRGRKARRQHIDKQPRLPHGSASNAFWLPLRLTRGRVTIKRQSGSVPV
jgi:hypothetical protein